MTTNNDELLNYTTAAAFLGMRIGTLYGMVSKKQIPHIRINKRIVRFSKEELKNFIEKHRVDLEKIS